MKVSVLCPTRNRVQSLVTSINSLISTVSDISVLEILIAVDEDDSSIEYFRTFKDKYFTNVDIKIITTKRFGYAYLNKYYNILAKNSSGDWLLSWGDPSYMITKNWDLYLEKYNNDEYYVIATNSNLDEEDEIEYICIHPIVSKKMIDKIGHHSMCRQTDSYVNNIGNNLNKLAYEKSIYIYHNRGGGSQIYTDVENYNIMVDVDIDKIINGVVKKNVVYDIVKNYSRKDLLDIRLDSYAGYVKTLIIKNGNTENLTDERVQLIDSLSNLFDKDDVLCFCDENQFPNYKKIVNLDITNNFLELDVCSKFFNKKTNGIFNLPIYKKSHLEDSIQIIFNGGVNLVEQNFDGLFVDNDVYIDFLIENEYINTYTNDIKIFCDKQKAYVTFNKNYDLQIFFKKEDVVIYNTVGSYIKDVEYWFYLGILIDESLIIEIYNNENLIFKKHLGVWS